MARELFLIPTSFAQQRLWFLDQLEPGSSVFNIPAALRISGRLDIDVLRRSVEEVVNRHETLRTRFVVTEDGEPAQIIESPAIVELSLLDLRSLAENTRRERVRELIDEEARRGFDLSRGPLLRTSLLRVDEEEYLLLFTMHHIISDAWSMGVLVREISVLYEALSRDAASPLPPLSIQYADYAVWQRERLESGELEQQLDYWVDRLADLPDVLALPTDYSRSAASSHRGGTVSFAIPAELSAELKALGRREGASLFITLMAGFQALLLRHSGQTRFVVGTPVAGRQRPELQDLIGFFVNTLALPADLSGDPSFVELLQRVRAEALAAYAHQEAPFERVVERLQPARTLDRAPLFQVMLALDNTPQQSLTLGGLKIDHEPVSTGAAKYDLSLLIEEREKGVAGVWFYDADLFDEASVKRLGERFNILLAGFVANPSLPVSRVPLLAKEEEQLLLVKGNDTSVPFPSEICIHELFEQQVERTPDADAVVFEGERLTYAELNAKANQIASHLRSLGVKPESRVGILMERSTELVAAILGTLKAGGAYVPLDPEYPRDRLAFMIKNSGVAVLLTQSELSAELPLCDASVVFVNEELAPAESIAPKSEISSDNLAYIIYTSGSTGTPKGVCVSHRSLVNYTLGVTNALGLNGGLTFAMVSTPAADLGNTVLYPSLCTGGCLHVISRERAADAAALAAYFEQHAIDCLKIVPSHLSALLAGDEAQKILPHRCLALGGEASSSSLIDRVKSLSDCAIFNHYGPTETTVGVLTHAVTEDRVRRLPLGRPLPNIKVYILDMFFNPAPTGVIGELYIGGEALARGYHERPAATAEKFIPDPFSGKAGGRLYRTGDLARYFADGTIEFLGRADNQVKVRGYRIELGEIETALREHPLVRDAAVVALEETSSEVSLAAYVAGSAIKRGELRQFLSDKLPRHMLPGSFTVLEEIPLTPNGKVNRQALPKPERESQSNLEVFQTATEELLAGIYEELLGSGRVNVFDDFFELGGHSLLATRLLSRVRQRFGVEVPLRKVFETPAVRGLAAQIDEAMGLGQAPDEHITHRSDTESSPLSPAQQRLWFLDQLEPGSSFYNLPGAVRLRGALNLKAFERSLNEVVRRHEILRATFPMIGGEPLQRIKPNFYLPLPVTDLTSMPDDEREAEAQRLCAEEAARPFNLSSGPQIRAQLLRLGEEDHIFLLTMHHIVADGWAMGIFIREVDALYQALTRGLPPPLAELPIQYADFASWQQQRLAGGVLERDLEYWTDRLADAPDLLALPTDWPRPPVQSYKGATFEFALSRELTEALKDLSRREGATLFMTLMAGFAVLLQRHAGQDDIVVGTPVAGRQQPETENLIGIFINMLVMRVDLSG
ncbi:MAG TPA: amino acid adenylation domain-containing protein, partial [Pyrinomonadaceae bacterium]|nr:amino acid adenylation domain-containing protein [Pyrinomonadaceae bacterium]